MRKHEDWRYYGKGIVKHAVTRGAHGDINVSALCGMGPYLAYFWLGSGSQTEIETLAMLPKCLHCVRKLEA